MSGLLSLAKYKQINPNTEFSDAELEFALLASQATAESLSGMRFGSEVTATAADGDNWKLTISGGQYFVGDQVRALAPDGASDPAPADLLTILEAGTNYVVVAVEEADFQIGKLLPVLEYDGDVLANQLYCKPFPVYSVESVKTRPTSDTLWSSSSVTTLEATQYEVFKSENIPIGVRIDSAARPIEYEGGNYLIKRCERRPLRCAKATYTCGFNTQIPADLVMAASQLVEGIAQAAQKGVFASESMDYYSYSQMDYSQLSVMPTSAISIFRRYGRL